MRALVTGALGFTGRYVCRALTEAGWEVWGTGHGPNDFADEEALEHYESCDLNDPGALNRVVAAARPEAVVHLAAVAFVGHGTASDFYRINLIGTRNLLQAIESAKTMPRSVILASSANVYGNGAEGSIREDRPANPSNDYAVSKSAMEQMARLWFDRVPILITRPFNYTGVGQDINFLIPKIVSHVRSKASTLELGNLNVARDFSDVRFVADVYRRLLESDHSGDTVNICSGQATTLEEVLSLAQEIAGHSIEVRVNPEFVRSNEVKMLCGDPNRLKSLTGPIDAPSLRETLRWMIEGP